MRKHFLETRSIIASEITGSLPRYDTKNLDKITVVHSFISFQQDAQT